MFHIKDMYKLESVLVPMIPISKSIGRTNTQLQHIYKPFKYSLVLRLELIAVKVVRSVLREQRTDNSPTLLDQKICYFLIQQNYNPPEK